MCARPPRAEYGVYTARLGGDRATSVYRPRVDESATAGDAEEQYSKLKSSAGTRFKPDRDFEGVDRSAVGGGTRTEPVRFERAVVEGEVDPLGLDKYASGAHNKRPLDAIGSRGGSMAASAGGGGGGGGFGDDEEDGGGAPRRDRIQFAESSSPKRQRR